MRRHQNDIKSVAVVIIAWLIALALLYLVFLKYKLFFNH